MRVLGRQPPSLWGPPPEVQQQEIRSQVQGTGAHSLRLTSLGPCTYPIRLASAVSCWALLLATARPVAMCAFQSLT